MRRLSLTVATLVVSLAASAVFAAPRQASWPSPDQQLKTSRVQPGSALRS